MAVKEWCRLFQPVQLYIVLIISVIFFTVELVVSHITHALVLLLDSYHMLCNILALAGCIVTIKYCNKNNERRSEETEKVSNNVDVVDLTAKKDTTPAESADNSTIKNTFGWARIDVIVMLVCCVFSTSLCFSILVEALQTLVHIDHQDEMHHPITVMFVGSAGLVLNGLCYLVIGGYTHHQGSFLHITKSGDVVLDNVVSGDSLKRGQRRLCRTTHTEPMPPVRNGPGVREICLDSVGCIFVIVCSVLVYYTEEDIAKFIDPILSIISSFIILILSYPYLKESCMILLQTIPDTINIESLRSELQKEFPNIKNVHDLHIWQLTTSRVFSTVHIIFQDPKEYDEIHEKIVDFFHTQGITVVTIQPEFAMGRDVNETTNCLIPCQDGVCKRVHCCPPGEEKKSDSTKRKSMPNAECQEIAIRVDLLDEDENAEIPNPTPAPTIVSSHRSKEPLITKICPSKEIPDETIVGVT